MPKFKKGDIIWRSDGAFSKEGKQRYIIYKITDVVWRFTDTHSYAGGRVERAYQAYVLDEYVDREDGYSHDNNIHIKYMRVMLESEYRKIEHEKHVEYQKYRAERVNHEKEVDYAFNPMYRVGLIGNVDFNFEIFNKLEYLMQEGHELGTRIGEQYEI